MNWNSKQCLYNSNGKLIISSLLFHRSSKYKYKSFYPREWKLCFYKIRIVICTTLMSYHALVFMILIKIQGCLIIISYVMMRNPSASLLWLLCFPLYRSKTCCIINSLPKSFKDNTWQPSIAYEFLNYNFNYNIWLLQILNQDAN